MFEYQQQNSALTLDDGLGEYRRVNPHLIESSDPQSVEMLRCHDATHVVFGCDTDLRGEVLVHAWTVLGTTQSIRDAHQATGAMEHQQLFADLGLRAGLVAFRTIPGIARVIRRGLRMSRKWPYSAFQPYLDRPLAEIRREFDIRVVL